MEVCESYELVASRNAVHGIEEAVFATRDERNDLHDARASYSSSGHSLSKVGLVI